MEESGHCVRTDPIPSCLDVERGDKPMGKKRPFPLSVVPAPGNGWFIVISLENGEVTRLLKPGWREDATHPYWFPSEQEAWDFIKQLFYFCIQQAHMQLLHTDKILNCKQCGRIFRARFFQYCHDCMQGNEFMLQQIWQGFYYLAGSQEGALHKISLLLKISGDEFTQIPEAFKVIVQKQLAIYAEMENQKNKPAKRLIQALKEQGGLHSRIR
jgi:hypothetical protein